jgi:hypothetical protein
MQSPSIGSSITQGLFSGFGWGIGTSLARGIFGSGTGSAPAPSSAPAPVSAPIPAPAPIPSPFSESGSDFGSLPSSTSYAKCFEETEELKRCVLQFGAKNCHEKERILEMCSSRV